MNTHQSINHWIDCWKASKPFFNKTSDSEQAETWNKRWTQADSSGTGMGSIKQKQMDDIFELLEEAGVNLEGASILDIGSGPGGTAIPFARAGATVTALDISKSALERLKRLADEESLNIKTIESSWWNTDIDRLDLRKKFDLVFVTSTPAVKDADGFDRMMACSRGHCYYSFFLQGGGPLAMDREALFRDVIGRESKRTAGKEAVFLNGFMYLYLLGHRPLVRVRHHEKNMASGWEEMAERTIRNVECMDTCSDADKEKIRVYFRNASVDGQYTEYTARREHYTGMMVWEVK